MARYSANNTAAHRCIVHPMRVRPLLAPMDQVSFPPQLLLAWQDALLNDSLSLPSLPLVSSTPLTYATAIATPTTAVFPLTPTTSAAFLRSQQACVPALQARAPATPRQTAQHLRHPRPSWAPLQPSSSFSFSSFSQATVGHWSYR